MATYYIVHNKQTGKRMVVTPANQRLNSNLWLKVGGEYKSRGAATAASKRPLLKSMPDASERAKEGIGAPSYGPKPKAPEKVKVRKKAPPAPEGRAEKQRRKIAQDRPASASYAPKRKSAADDARRVSGAKGLGVLEGKLDRAQRGRIPGSKLPSAHSKIKSTTAKEKDMAGNITGGVTGLSLLPYAVDAIKSDKKPAPTRDIPGIDTGGYMDKGEILRTIRPKKSKRKTPGGPTVAVGKVDKIRKQQEADKRIAANLKGIEEKKAKQNIVKSTTRGLPKTATDLPFDAGPERERATRKPTPPVRGLNRRRPVPSSPPPTTKRASAKIPAHAKRAAQLRQEAAAMSYSPTDFAIGGPQQQPRRADPTPRPRVKPPVPAASPTGDIRKLPMKSRGQDMAGMAPPDKVVPAGSPGKGKQAFMKREDKRASWKPPKQKDYTKGAVESLRKKASLDKAIKSAVAESKIDVPAGGRRKPGYTPDVALGKRRRKYEAADKRKRDFDYMEEEQGGQRKGGKITKKSSTPRRSRPKNPTLQKTSYNY